MMGIKEDKQVWSTSFLTNKIGTNEVLAQELHKSVIKS